MITFVSQRTWPEVPSDLLTRCVWVWLVTFLLLSKNIMTRTTYRSTSSFGLQFQRARVHNGGDSIVEGRMCSGHSGNLKVHILYHKHEAERVEPQAVKAFSLKPVLSGILPPAKLHHPKWCHQLGTKCSSAWDYGDILAVLFPPTYPRWCGLPGLIVNTHKGGFTSHIILTSV